MKSPKVKKVKGSVRKIKIASKKRSIFPESGFPKSGPLNSQYKLDPKD